MSWYKFREGMLVREDVVAGTMPEGWKLLNLNSFIASVEKFRETEAGSLVKLGFLDCRNERVPIAPTEVIFRLTRTDFGWGRYFNYRPGKLAGYSSEDGRLLIACSLVKIEGIEAFTWQIEPETFNITYDELHSFYRQVSDLCGLLLKKEEYPVLFE